MIKQPGIEKKEGGVSNPETPFLSESFSDGNLLSFLNLPFPDIDYREDNRKRKQQYAYDLRCGQSEKKSSYLVSPEKLICESDNRIDEKINDQQPVLKLLFLIKHQ